MRILCRRTPALLSILLLACGGEPSSLDGPEVVRERVGDTLVVRTLAGSVWQEGADLVPELEIGVLEGDPAYMFGNLITLAVDDGGRIFAMDRQSLSLRVYGPDGQHLGDWGRDGNGPGEFAQPDGGLVVLSDGRVVVRDPGNARLQLFTAEGERADEWPVIRSGFSTSNPMHVGRGDTLYTSAVINLGDETDIADWRRGYIVIHEGAVVDTVEIPLTGYEAPRLRAEREGSASISRLPFAPDEEVAWHPDGFFVRGISEDYSITLLDPAGPLRIERDAPSVPLAGGERAYHREGVMRGMRNTDPDWRWSGPDVPDEKPAFRSIRAADDGRIWVGRHTEGERRDNPDYDPTDPLSEAPEHIWTERLSWDVFERDGTFLGTVWAPQEFRTYPRPVLRGDHVWGVATDDLGVQRIVRYRITPRDAS